MAGDMMDEPMMKPDGGQGMAMMSKMEQMHEMMAEKRNSMPPEKMEKMMKYMDEMMKELGGETDWMGSKK
jgi:hypothetical protein